jgi:hypothetical protein
MEMPIISPSMVSYADELNFSHLLEDLLKDKHNGFIRVTSGSLEGYILFKNGKQVAASYDRYSKLEAVKSIASAMQENDTVIEVFKLKESPVDYLIDVNKPYLIEPGYDVYDVIGELKKSDDTEIEEPSSDAENNSSKRTLESESEITEEAIIENTQIIPEHPKNESKSIKKPNSETIIETSTSEEEESELTPEKDSKIESSDSEVKLEQSNLSDTETSIIVDDSTYSKEDELEQESKTEYSDLEVKLEKSNSSNTKPPISVDDSTYSKESESEEKIQTQSETIEEIEKTSTIKTESEEESIDRSRLLKKYGIKEINENDVENILYSYNGGSIDDNDVEKIELTLMNKIKKTVLGIPKVRGTEVLVFLDNTNELSGNINIIIEYESKGFFSRMIGESRDTENLRRQIINIAQIEIKKSFRKYPEIIDNFDINVEI